MAVSSRYVRGTELHQMSKKWNNKDREEISPERTKIWSESPKHKLKSERKVPVVYYLTRNGQLEHPHFMEVPLSSPDGLYLRDVINRLNFLRGKGMASLYSWSAKRSYRNGFVWHDLAEHDFIYPAHGQEYVLKGSELVDSATITTMSQSEEITSSNSSENTVPLVLGDFSSSNKNTSKIPVPEVRKQGEDREFPAVTRRRNQSWCSADFHEYRVYKAESSDDSAGKAAANASTQTDDRGQRRRAIGVVEEEEEERESQSTELSRGEISPPPSDSSPETLETLLKADGGVIVRSGTVNEDQTANNQSSGKSSKTSSVFMQLLSCGSMSFKDCGPGYGKDHGLNLISQYKSRMPRGSGCNQVEKDAENTRVEYQGMSVKLEDKEYFSGSLIETKKEEYYPALKRSSSFNADRSTKLELREKEIEGVRAKCIPRRPKNQATKKEGNSDLSCSSSASISSSTSSQHGSKRVVVQPQV